MGETFHIAEIKKERQDSCVKKCSSLYCTGLEASARGAAAPAPSRANASSW